MKIGIIGPPQTGKTSIFKILLDKSDISTNIGVFRPSDPRIEQIAGVVSSKKKTYPELTFVDIGSIKDFNRKDVSGLGDTDLFISVIGSFFSEDPKKDFDSLITDLVVHDLEVVQNRIERIKKESARNNSEQEIALLEKYQAHLSEGKLLSKLKAGEGDSSLLSGLLLLSQIPLILAINSSESDIGKKIDPLKEYVESINIPYVIFFGKEELDLLGLEKDEREKFLKELGDSYTFKEDISRLIFKELNLITFFTAAENETRGWYLKKDLPALEAAGKVHSDIKRGFIRAEVLNCKDFLECGSMHNAREKGLLRLEGKEYIIKDGDIINIRFSV
ncbi:MAG: DUF933 domain-containing protein [Candidatus Omnitrophota bacterium]